MSLAFSPCPSLMAFSIFDSIPATQCKRLRSQGKEGWPAIFRCFDITAPPWGFTFSLLDRSSYTSSQFLTVNSITWWWALCCLELMNPESFIVNWLETFLHLNIRHLKKFLRHWLKITLAWHGHHKVSLLQRKFKCFTIWNVSKLTIISSPASPRPPSLWRSSATGHWTFLCTSSEAQSEQQSTLFEDQVELSVFKRESTSKIWNLVNYDKAGLPEKRVAQAV